MKWDNTAQSTEIEYRSFKTKLTSNSHDIYTHRFNEVERAVYWFHLVRLWTESCPLYIFNNTRQIHFTFHISNLIFWQVFQNCSFDFVFCWLGIQYDSIEWVIMRRWGYPQNTGVLVVVVFRISCSILIYRYLFALFSRLTCCFIFYHFWLYETAQITTKLQMGVHTLNKSVYIGLSCKSLAAKYNDWMIIFIIVISDKIQ